MFGVALNIIRSARYMRAAFIEPVVGTVIYLNIKNPDDCKLFIYLLKESLS